ncbi:MAG: chemotaxis response regulator protein-glutamate methylesterase [Planctomycetota bacterium]|jgi:two-component system chemotaxis response regulator CheB|nr:chemotaxis response regulator protein-glutamate methylesterase [Planctomycetota bacterium]
MAPKIRVLIVDDSALVRDILAVGLSRDPDIEVVGTAQDPFEAGEIIPTLRPDVMTLDVEMPRMNGLEFLRRLMPQYPLPVVMVSALTEKGRQLTFDALALGAVDFVAKPKGDLARGMELLLNELVLKIKTAANAKLLRFRSPASGGIGENSRHETAMALKERATKQAVPSFRVIIIGASTGGTEAVREVITRFPGNTPGIVVVQHMPAGFTRLFANRLDSEAAMKVKEAENGDRIINGRILVAPGGKQLRLQKDPHGGFGVGIYEEDRQAKHAPSIDVAMLSAAELAGSKGIGVVLTGMGSDGAVGLKAMREVGARCLAQDEATSVVFGMPDMAFRNGAAERLVPIGEMAKTILSFLAAN